MNKKQFLILIGLVALLGVWSLSRRHSQNQSWQGTDTAAGQKLLGEFDVNAVNQISIKQGTNELLLAKKDDLWRVAQRGDYPANFADLSSLLVKLKDLKVIQTEQVGASQLPRLELAAGSPTPPTAVEFRDASGKAIKSLTLGKKHMRSGGGGSPMGEMGDEGGFPDGRYVQAGEVKDSVAVISDPLDDLSPDAKRWLKKDFIKVEKPKSITVTFPEATNSWTLTRESESAQWTLAAPKAEEKLDPTKSGAVTSPFSYTTINDVAVGLSPEQAGLNEATKIGITTFDGFDYVISVGSKTNDSYLVKIAVTADLPKERTATADEKPEDKAKADKEFADHQKQLEEKLTRETTYTPWTYELSTWTVEALLKKRGELLEEKKPESAETPETPAPFSLPPGN